MENYAHIANSPILWAVTIVAIGLVLIQAYGVLKKAWTAGRKMGISEEKLKTAVKTSIIAAVGPSFVVVVGMVSLIIVVGGPTALMRLGYIGNVVYEIMATEFAASAYGTTITSSNIPAGVFSTALWGMAIGCIGWIVFAGVFTDKMGRFVDKLSGKSAAKVIAISTGAMIGAYGYFGANYIMGTNKNMVAFITGFIVMQIVLLIYRKIKIKWLNRWSVAIAMFSGIIVAAFL